MLAVTRYSIDHYSDLRRFRCRPYSVQRKIDFSFPRSTPNSERLEYAQVWAHHVQTHGPSNHPYQSRRFAQASFPPASDVNARPRSSGYYTGYLAGLVRPSAATLEAGPRRGDTQFQIRTIVTVNSAKAATATTRGTQGPHDWCWHWLGCLVVGHSLVGQLAATPWMRTG